MSNTHTPQTESKSTSPIVQHAAVIDPEYTNQYVQQSVSDDMVTWAAVTKSALGTAITEHATSEDAKEVLELSATVTIRTATVKAENVGWGSDPLKTVNAYLPSTYDAEQIEDQIVITGYDNAGWTLDGYVLPRLASGMIFATEVV